MPLRLDESTANEQRATRFCKTPSIHRFTENLSMVYSLVISTVSDTYFSVPITEPAQLLSQMGCTCSQIETDLVLKDWHLDIRFLKHQHENRHPFFCSFKWFCEQRLTLEPASHLILGAHLRNQEHASMVFCEPSIWLFGKLKITHWPHRFILWPSLGFWPHFRVKCLFLVEVNWHQILTLIGGNLWCLWPLWICAPTLQLRGIFWHGDYKHSRCICPSCSKRQYSTVKSSICLHSRASQQVYARWGVSYMQLICTPAAWWNTHNECFNLHAIEMSLKTTHAKCFVLIDLSKPVAERGWGGVVQFDQQSPDCFEYTWIRMCLSCRNNYKHLARGPRPSTLATALHLK